MISNDLIFDIGLHRGLDAQYYLNKGFRVIGLEAVPALVAECRKKLHSHGGRLVIVNKALYHEAGKTVTFYTVPGKDDWGSLNQQVAEKAVEKATPITVETVDLTWLFDRFGVPRYIKCDIEGADIIFREQLIRETRRPTFVSIEVNDGHEGAALAECGYEVAQIVNQWFHPFRQPPNPAREGKFVAAQFTGETSGLFGLELPATSWQPIDEIDAITRRWKELRAIDEQLAPGWLDVHAATRAALV
ncbi:FkbM family methyltransferase [Aminobacter anthyllidis]|uniref:FkbM family methyltransferase n=1 Tax=Aminobacter anthyllidis TaxID=1035067 RepID=UPI002457140B|nr:FkbM family methyltransferase [Aminobacter anthyllidis]MDH4984418.1 FkbM family methyltransferase [Aminobacter anthyllidis]